MRFVQQRNVETNLQDNNIFMFNTIHKQMAIKQNNSVTNVSSIEGNLLIACDWSACFESHDK